MRSLVLKSLVCAVITLTPFALYGQVAIGLPPFGSFSGGPDVTNLGNLNLHYTFPIFSKPGRGIAFNYALSLDSSVWFPSAGHWTPVANWGWHGSSDAFDGVVPVKLLVRHCTDPDGDTVFYNTRSYGPYTDGFGVTHPVFAFEIDSSLCGDGSSTPGTATDGSGYILTPAGSLGRVTARSGQVISTSTTVGFGSGTLIDANGNQVSAASGTFTDTLGMNVLTATGGAPNPLVFTYHDSSNTARTVTVDYTSFTIQTNFACSGVTEYSGTASLATSIVYPDGSSYSFTYEPTPGFSGSVTGRIKSVTLPTGATITYNYTGSNNGIICADGSTAGFDRVTSDGTVSYSRSGSGTKWTTTFLDASSPTRNQTTVSFQTNSGNFYETQRITYQGASTVLAQTDTCYSGAAKPCINTALTLPFSNIEKYLTLNNNQQKLTTTAINSLGLTTEVDEYDFGVGAPGALLRKTLIAYNTSLGNNIADHPASVIVQDGGGNQKAKTTFGYDETTATPTSGVPMHSAITGSRGNLTTLGRWLDTTSSNLNTTFTYDDTGNVLSITDPGSHQTQFLYTDNFSDGINRNSLAYLTQVNMPDTNSPSLAHHVTHTQYEPNTGLPSMATDQNGQQTTLTYDLMLRPLLTNFPDGGQTSVSYPSNKQTVVQNKIDSTRSTYNTTLLDTYGRVYRTAQANAESTPYDVVDTCYDSNGRTKFHSYPYQAASYTGTTVCSGAGDSFAYDGAGRTTTVTHSDSSTVQISYNGRATQTTDEGNGSFNVSRIQQSDGLGRLASVCEVTSVSLLGNGGTPTGCGLDITATGFLTTYAYNTLDNLTTVTQGSLVNRSFGFDSLSRMTSESEPEWGMGSTMSYTYNGDSLLTQRTRPAPNQTNPAVTVATNYGYDELHRLRTRTYTGDPSGTPSATFNYDESSVWSQSLSNTIGVMSSVSSGSTGQVFSYDNVGRVLNNWQCTPRTCGGTPYLLSYSYDLAGDLTSAGNGAGVTFSYSYNSAARLAGMTSSLVDSQHPAPLLSNVHYNQFGSVSDTLGNGLNETMGYSARGVPQSYSATPYSFTLGVAANGAITSGNDSINGNWTYGYDQFNRLASSNKNSGTQTFSYVYDRYGNRLQQNAPQGGPAPQYLFDNNNRISSSGVTYDALGNIQNDGLGNAFTYDAESRQIKIVNSSGTYNYAYDADGRRISNNSFEFLYDLAGRATTLFGATSGIWNYGEIYAGSRHIATYSGATTNFLHADWLGTKHMMSNLSGTNSQNCTSLPFGDAQSCTGTEWGFNHVTDDMHDSEANMEHTWYRQLSTTQGRWTSPDPYLNSFNLVAPQSLNRYTYVLNDPIDLADPLGLQQIKIQTPGLPCPINGDGCSTVCRFGRFTVFDSVCDFFLASLFGSRGPGSTGDGGNCLPPGVQGPPTPECVLGPTLLQVVCSLTPNGRTTGLGGSLGSVFGITGSGEQVRNWDTGEVSYFYSSGLTGGLVGAQGGGSAGPIWGLNTGNTNYKAGSTTISGGAGLFGASISSNSPGLHDIKGSLNPSNLSGPFSVTVNVGLSNIPFNGTVSVTNYSTPMYTTTQIPTELVDQIGMVLRSFCRK